MRLLHPGQVPAPDKVLFLAQRNSPAEVYHGSLKKKKNENKFSLMEKTPRYFLIKKSWKDFPI